MTTRNLRAADDLLEPAIAETLAALPAADAATAQLALLLARTIDGMDDDQRARMLPQHVGQLLRVLELLRPEAAPAVSQLARLRAAHAETSVRYRR